MTYDRVGVALIVTLESGETLAVRREAIESAESVDADSKVTLIVTSSGERHRVVGTSVFDIVRAITAS